MTITDFEGRLNKLGQGIDLALKNPTVNKMDRLRHQAYLLEGDIEYALGLEGPRAGELLDKLDKMIATIHKHWNVLRKQQKN